MKPVLTLAGLFGAAVLLLATPGQTHKVDWCHFPPGQNGAKYNILSIDEAADGSVSGQHLNHEFDGPVCIGPPTQVINGKTYNCADLKIPNVTALGDNCGVSSCGNANAVSINPLPPHYIDVQLTAPDCTCPVGTERSGQPPLTGAAAGDAPTGKSCGGTAG
jgi:hypothetical protein